MQRPDGPEVRRRPGVAKRTEGQPRHSPSSSPGAACRPPGENRPHAGDRPTEPGTKRPSDGMAVTGVGVRGERALAPSQAALTISRTAIPVPAASCRARCAAKWKNPEESGRTSRSSTVPVASIPDIGRYSNPKTPGTLGGMIHYPSARAGSSIPPFIRETMKRRWRWLGRVCLGSW